MQSGLLKIQPKHTDYSFLHTFGALQTDPKGLPESFSIYDGRVIPNQEVPDTRFYPALPPLYNGCTGESITFNAGIQDGKFYNPEFTYENTPPCDSGGRDIREAMKSAKTLGLKDNTGAIGFKRGDYYNVYGAGKLDDFDAARIALWINQIEKRSVIVGTFWYWGDQPPTTLTAPSFKPKDATMHCYLITGWKDDTLELIPWVGQNVGDSGKFYVSRAIWNALMAQPWTGSFTQAKTPSDTTPIPLGYNVYIDHLIYFIRSLWHF